MGELLGCFYYFANIIRHVVKCSFFGHIHRTNPYNGNAKPKGMCIYNFDRQVQTALPSLPTFPESDSYRTLYPAQCVMVLLLFVN